MKKRSKISIWGYLLLGLVIVAVLLPANIRLFPNNKTNTPITDNTQVETPDDDSGGTDTPDDGSGDDTPHTHVYDQQIANADTLKTAATCTTAAIYYKSCACEAVGTATFTNGAPLGHDEVSHAAQAPTCTAIGWDAYVTCSRCDYTTREEQPALGHNNINGQCSICGEDLTNCSHSNTGTKYIHLDEENGSFCTIDMHGVYNACLDCGMLLELQNKAICTWRSTPDLACDYCGEENTHDVAFTYSINAAGKHMRSEEVCETCRMSFPVVVSDDCIFINGVCAACGAEENVAPDTSHTHAYDQQTVNNETLQQAATCTAPAFYYYSCACGEKGTSTFTSGTALGHAEQSHAAQAPTCTAIGWEAYVTCSRCDYTTYAEQPALGHDFADEWEYTTEEHYHACTRTGCTEQDSVAAHTYDGELDENCNVCNALRAVSCSHPTSETVMGYAATCTEAGLTDGVKCTACGETLTAQEEISALGHAEQSHAAQAPTCTAIGWEAYVTCSRCDYTTYAEQPALGHAEQSHAAQAATCTAIGWEAYVTCSRCDYTTYAEQPALGHNYTNGTCSRCGATDPDYITVDAFANHQPIISSDYTTFEWSGNWTAGDLDANGNYREFNTVHADTGNTDYKWLIYTETGVDPQVGFWSTSAGYRVIPVSANQIGTATNYDMLLTWTAPEAGVVKIGATDFEITHAATNYNLRLYLNDELIYPAEGYLNIGYGDAIDTDEELIEALGDLTVTVKEGDKLYFRCTRITQGMNTAFMPAVEYVESTEHVHEYVTTVEHNYSGWVDYPCHYEVQTCVCGDEIRTGVGSEAVLYHYDTDEYRETFMKCPQCGEMDSEMFDGHSHSYEPGSCECAVCDYVKSAHAELESGETCSDCGKVKE